MGDAVERQTVEKVCDVVTWQLVWVVAFAGEQTEPKGFSAHWKMCIQKVPLQGVKGMVGFVRSLCVQG